jgi:signal transduction histidine kinase/ligand-binding sensor domain-containing protein
MAYVLALSLQCVAQELEPETKLTQYAHKVWDIGDAGLLGTPQSITQTRDGYIWVSTSNGLFRFDGVRFVQWESQPGEVLPSNSLWHLYGARNGSLYMGTDRGLARITADHIYNYPNSPRWPGPFVEDANGVVWMGISGAHSASSPLCSIGETKLECLGTQDSFGCGRGLSNALAADGSIWVGTDEGTCRWKKGDTPEKQEISSLVKQNGLGAVTSLASSSDGMLWAGTQHNGEGEGLLQFAHGAWNTYVTPSVDGRKLNVSALLAAKNNVLWIGTTDKGLYRLSNGVLDHIDVEDGLSGRRVLSILEDREGGIWAVTPMGMDFFRDYATLSFTSNEGTLDTRARAVAVDGTDSVYLGGDVLIRMRHGKIDQINDQNAKPLQDIQFLFADSRGDLWIGAGRRLFILKNGKAISEISSFSKEGAEVVVYITEDRNREIWVSSEDLKTRNSFLVKIHDEKVTGKYGGGPLVGNQMINALANNPEGGIWAGGALHGLFRFRDGQFERVMAKEFNDRIENLLQERGGALWLVTPNGFIRYADGKMKKLDAANGLPCDGAVNIQDDGEGSKWFYMHCGIMSVSEKSISRWWNDSRIPISGRLFGPLEGARPNLFNGSPAQTSDGELWSANSYDFQVINRHHLPFNPIPPPVIIEMISADGKELMPDRDLELEPHTREVEVDYTGLSLRIPEQVHFRYQLVGHDANWVEAGTRRQAFYNDLKPGRYVFQVIASNNDRVWNTAGAKIVFNVMPAWYQTLLFRVFAVLLGTALVIAAYYLRLSRYTAALKMRFDERLDERTRLARDLHDTLLQTIQGSKLVADNARDNADNPQSTLRALDRLSEWLDRAILEGRDALEALRSSASEFDSLTSALRRAADDCTFDSQIKVIVLTFGMDRELHPIARDEVYRIAFEAIRNACTHSGCMELIIELRYRKRSFRLEVRDDGRGIDSCLLQSGKTGHFGMTGMRERALNLGGTLTVKSEIDRGTTVSLSVPGRAVYLKQPWRPHVWIRDAVRQFRRW